MSSVNKVFLLGNLGDDPKIKRFDNGGVICNLSIATTEKWQDRNTGEQKSNTDWHNVQVSGKQAENCEKYLKKGDKVHVEGKNRTRSYTDSDGQTKWVTEVVCRSITFLTPKGNQGSATEQYHNQNN